MVFDHYIFFTDCIHHLLTVILHTTSLGTKRKIFIGNILELTRQFILFAHSQHRSLSKSL